VNEHLWQLLADLGKEKDAIDAVNRFTVEKMFRLYYVPNIYYLDPTLTDDCSKLLKELAINGYIDLDKNGKPCVLSGEPPVLKEEGKQKT
jgi:hypothetical protein